jgi:hypothetical protein
MSEESQTPNDAEQTLVNSQKDAGTGLDSLILELKQRTQSASSPKFTGTFKKSNSIPFKEILDREKARKQTIKNNNLVSDQKLKARSLVALFIFLGIETLAIFLLAFAQGFEYRGFNLDDWSLRIIIVATLGQITAMLTIAVKHLFPSNTRR